MSKTIQFVLILATAIVIHGEKDQTTREATLTVKNDFEDGLSFREFKVDFPGIVGSDSATIKISRVGDSETDAPRVEYKFKDASKPRILYFELKKEEAPAGYYQVQVCPTSGKCSAKRAAFDKLSSGVPKPTLSCIKGKGEEENMFHTFINEMYTKTFTIPISAGESFVPMSDCGKAPACTKLGLTSNPGYTEFNDKRVFYAAVWYNGKTLRDLFDTTVKDELKTHGYCSRKYVFWASVHVVDTKTKHVKRRFRGTHIIDDALAQKYILDADAQPFPVEFLRYDEKPLPKGNYEVSVSFCASDKDDINSSICSDAIYAPLVIEPEQS